MRHILALLALLFCGTAAAQPWGPGPAPFNGGTITGAINAPSYQIGGIPSLVIGGGVFSSGAWRTCTNDCTTLVGHYTGANLAATDQLTTAVGFNALNAANSTTTRGTESTAVGWNAGASLNGTDSYYATLYGVNNLSACATCRNYVTMGVDAGRDVTAGTGGIFIGPQGVGIHWNGNNNIFMGTGTGTGASDGSSTGSSNTVIGFGSFGASGGTSATSNNSIYGANIAPNCTTCQEMVIIGTAAGASVVSEFNSVIVGYGAGTATTNQSQNTYVGALAGAAETGIGSTMLGYEAGFKATGNQNTIIGNQVGSGTLTTGAGNILIGYSNAVDTPGAGSNFTLNIGGVVKATGINTPSTSATTIAGTLSVVGAYSSGATAGLTCSGTPTASFASTLGIVTHC